MKYRLMAILFLFSLSFIYSRETAEETDDLGIELFDETDPPSADSGDNELDGLNMFDESSDPSAEDSEEILLFDESDTALSDDSLFADETDTTLSDDSLFTDEIPSDESSGGIDFFGQFFDNMNSQTISRYYLYFNELEVAENANPEPDMQRHMFEQHTRTETSVSDDFWKIDFVTTFDFGNPKHTFQAKFLDLEDRVLQDWFQDTDNQRHFFDVNELYLSLFFPACDIFLGKKIYVNTLSTLYSPADNYSAQDLNDPLNPGSFGKYQLQGDFFIGDSTLTFIFFPVYQGGKGISPLSRWGYYKALEYEENLAGAEDDGTRHYEDIIWSNFSYLFRYKTTLSGLDLFVSAFYGLAGNSVGKDVEGEVESDVVPVINGSAGFSATIEKFELHGETLYNYTIDSKDDDYIRYVAGLRYTLDELPGFIPLEKIEMAAEYAGEHIFKRQSAADYSTSSEDARLLKNDVLAMLLFQYNEKIKLRVLGQYEIIDMGLVFSSNFSWQFLENLEMSIGCDFFFASDASNYYYWRDSNRLLVNFTYDY